MLSIGVLCIALCAVQVISLPVTSLGSEGDTKVLKCIVEVISDTLSKPNPVPISQDCLETLRGDERIISILRHQNLLKELQELAAQGAMERLQKQKKRGGYGEELSGVLEKHNKPLPSEKSEVSDLHGKSLENDEVKKQLEEEDRRVSSEHTQDGDSAEELESNEISKREDSSEDEEIDNRITDEINDMEPPKDNREDTSNGRTAEEKETNSKKEPESSQIDESSDPDQENGKQDGNETDNEEDDTQREDNSMRMAEDFNKENSETESSKESKRDSEAIDCTDYALNGDEDASSKDLEDSKRWNKMDELAKELRAKKCAVQGNSEEDPDHSMKIPPKDQKSSLGSQEQEDKQQWPQPRDDSDEGESPISKRTEERKEEGSANRKPEDQELESLAAIEAELESVAHKLHDLRRG